jgi:hypothetical protein
MINEDGFVRQLLLSGDFDRMFFCMLYRLLTRVMLHVCV